MRRIALLLLIILPMFSCAQTETVKILFIGNSFTHNNDLPDIERKLVKAAGLHAEIQAHLALGRSINHFIRDKSCFKWIKYKQWDYIVIQDYQGFYYDSLGKFDSLGCPTDLLVNNLKFQDSIKQLVPKARIIYFAGWEKKGGIPDRFPKDNTQKLIKRILCNYKYLNDLPGVHNTIAPVGVAWMKCMDHAHGSESCLYVDDNRHPDFGGSYLSALVIFGTIFRQSPVGINYKTKQLTYDYDTMFMRFAEEALVDSFAYSSLANITLPVKTDGRKVFTRMGYTNYQWYMDTIKIKGATSDELLIKNYRGKYHVEALDKEGFAWRSFPIKVEKPYGLCVDSNFDCTITNPATHYFSIAYTNTGTQPLKVCVYNSMGHKVVDAALSPEINDLNHSENIDISSLPKGCYTVEISQPHRRIRKKLFVD